MVLNRQVKTQSPRYGEPMGKAAAAVPGFDRLRRSATGTALLLPTSTTSRLGACGSPDGEWARRRHCASLWQNRLVP